LLFSGCCSCSERLIRLFYCLVNGGQVAKQWVATNNLAGTQLPSSPSNKTQAQKPGGRSYTIEDYNQNGQTYVRFLKIEGMPHAWSGGSSQGTYTDPSGPDASAMIAQYFFSFVGTNETLTLDSRARV
jgi:poly(3-hydroxybutyrate) depolymerase